MVLAPQRVSERDSLALHQAIQREVVLQHISVVIQLLYGALRQTSYEVQVTRCCNVELSSLD